MLTDRFEQNRSTHLNELENMLNEEFVALFYKISKATTDKELDIDIVSDKNR